MAHKRWFHEQELLIFQLDGMMLVHHPFEHLGEERQYQVYNRCRGCISAILLSYSNMSLFPILAGINVSLSDC